MILSFHDFEKTPSYDELCRVIDEMVVCGADVCKIAVIPETFSDVAVIHLLVEYMQLTYPAKEYVLISMGEL